MEPEDSEVVLSERYDGRSEMPMSAHIVRLVAVASDRRPTDLEPLGRHVDAGAIDRLFGPAKLADDGSSVAVTFAYEGYTVDVDDDGTVRLLVASD